MASDVRLYRLYGLHVLKAALQKGSRSGPRSSSILPPPPPPYVLLHSQTRVRIRYYLRRFEYFIHTCIRVKNGCLFSRPVMCVRPRFSVPEIGPARNTTSTRKIFYRFVLVVPDRIPVYIDPKSDHVVK